MLEKWFKLKQNNTTVKTEVMAGITTFMTMAYILAVNPGILGEAGMDRSGVMIASALAAGIGSMLMAFLANLPFALAPGMGLNATFTYTVVIGLGMSWQIALFAVFVEGIIFIVLSLTNVREAIFNSIPASLKMAIGSGIALFITFIGFQNAKIIQGDPEVLVKLTKFEDMHGQGLASLLAIVGIIIISVLLIKKVKGGILLGIAITWLIGIVLELVGVFTPEVSTLPSFAEGLKLDGLGKVFGQAFAADFTGVNFIDFLVVVFTLLFVDMFDTLGALIGVSAKANFLDKDGRLPKIKGALLADAMATCAGAVLGTSTTTTYIESASGVEEGGRTGLTAATTAVLFFVAVFFAPIFTAIPSFATAPGLIIVGVYMMGSVVKINFDDFTDAVPAFLCIIIMPFSYSIADGIFAGVISYVLINLIAGKAKEKKISVLMYALCILFILRYIFL